MTLTGAAKLAGVVGWPIAHSLSPRLHGRWLAEYGIDGAFVPLAIRREDFAVALHGLRLAGFTGVNVTVPHKEAAFAIAHTSDAAAEAAGAANLLLFGADGRIAAHNTDSAGLTESLIDGLGATALQGQTAVLLGAGGAARAAILSLDALGAHKVWILARVRKRAEDLAYVLRSHVKANLAPGGLDDWAAAAGDANLLVNATSAGMKGNPPLALALDPLPKTASVCDLIYNPLETALLRQAQGPRSKNHRWPGHAAAPGGPGLRGFFRREADGNAGLAPDARTGARRWPLANLR